jgi:hypothetical protein
MEAKRRRLNEGRAWRCPCVRDAHATPSEMLANQLVLSPLLVSLKAWVLIPWKKSGYSPLLAVSVT